MKGRRERALHWGAKGWVSGSDIGGVCKIVPARGGADGPTGCGVGTAEGGSEEKQFWFYHFYSTGYKKMLFEEIALFPQ